MTTISEIGDRIYRISTFVPGITPAGFTFNQFLVDAEQPLLFHCGMRALFPAVAEAVGTVMPVERLRWISFGHVEADECGAMNQWLAAAPEARVLHGETGVLVSLNDLADRPPLAIPHGGSLDLGGRRIRLLCTPHVPHGWESILLWEETTRTLLCGDLFTHIGNGPALVESDIVGPAVDGERVFRASTLAPGTRSILESLAVLGPTTLALMHGSSFRGDGAAALRALASGYESIAAEVGGQS